MYIYIIKFTNALENKKLFPELKEVLEYSQTFF
jgi:hypothetical protein